MKNISKKLIYGAGAIATFLPVVAQAGRMYDDGMYYSKSNDLAAGLGVIFGFLLILFWVGVLLLWIFWLFMVIDIVKRDWKKDGDKTAYLILVLFLNILGAAIYYFVVKRHLDSSNKATSKK